VHSKPNQERAMKKLSKPTTGTQASRKQAAPVPKTSEIKSGPQPIDAQQLRHVAGGVLLPKGGW
jgi:hypothetical protein